MNDGGGYVKKGKLKIYFGYFYETAKTRTMIEEIIEKYQNKEKVIIADVLINDIEIKRKASKTSSYCLWY